MKSATSPVWVQRPFSAVVSSIGASVVSRAMAAEARERRPLRPRAEPARVEMLEAGLSRDTPKADGDPGTQVVVRAPELHRPLLVKRIPEASLSSVAALSPEVVSSSESSDVVVPEPSTESVAPLAVMSTESTLAGASSSEARSRSAARKPPTARRARTPLQRSLSPPSRSLVGDQRSRWPGSEVVSREL